jgi:hypothetical protein
MCDLVHQYCIYKIDRHFSWSGSAEAKSASQQYNSVIPPLLYVFGVLLFISLHFLRQNFCFMCLIKYWDDNFYRNGTDKCKYNVFYSEITLEIKIFLQFSNVRWSHIWQDWCILSPIKTILNALLYHDLVKSNNYVDVNLV